MAGLTRRQLLTAAAYAAPIVALAPSPAAAAPLPAASPSLMAATSARSAFDSYGINTHLSFLTGSTWANTESALAWLQYLGVGAIRQYLPRTAHGREVVKLGVSRLAANGVRWCCTTLRMEDVATLDQARVAVNGQLDWLQANVDLNLVDSLPGPNEPNSSGLPKAEWVRRTKYALQALKEETRRRPAFNNVLIQGAPLNMKGGARAVAPDAKALGNITQWIDRGDAHLYPGDNDPEWTLQERLTALEPMHLGKPVCISEGGYTTSIGRGYTGGADLVPEDIASLYAPKHLLVHLLGGRMFFSYQLLDEAPPYADTDINTREAGFGLVATPTLDPATWRAKPAFEAMRRTLSLFRDVSSAPTPGLRVTVTGLSTKLRTALLQRSDGRFLLAIWQAATLYNWDRKARTGRYLNVAPVDVTVTLDRSLPVNVFEPSTQDAPVDSFAAQLFTERIGGGLTVLQIG